VARTLADTPSSPPLVAAAGRCACDRPHPRRRIVLTGGPGAGKTAIPLTGLPPLPSAPLGPLLARARVRFPLPRDQGKALRAGFRAVMLPVLEDILEYGQTVAYEHGTLVLAAFIELSAADSPGEDVLALVAEFRRPTAFRKELKRWLGVDPWASKIIAPARQGASVTH
jgi:hypothetical protein